MWTAAQATAAVCGVFKASREGVSGGVLWAAVTKAEKSALAMRQTAGLSHAHTPDMAFPLIKNLAHIHCGKHDGSISF